MQRRTAIKSLAAAAAMAWMLPSCISDPRKVAIALNHLKVTADEEDLLGLVADTIIPETDTPGARSVAAHHFTLVMVDDCLPEGQQQQYLSGMRDFESALKKITGDDFRSASPERREEMLSALIDQRELLPADVRFFWERSRSYILQGYTSSQYFLTEVKPYQLIPGPEYKGCVPVSNSTSPLS